MRRHATSMLTVLVLAFVIGSTAASAQLAGQEQQQQQQQPQPQQQDQPAPGDEKPQTVIRTYNIADLMRSAADYPLDSQIVPPTGFGHGSGAGGGGGGNLFGLSEEREDTTDLLDPLSNLIVELVDPNSWEEAGGSVGHIKSFASLLVITQTEENHRKIQALLDEIRRNAGPSQIVAIRATWLVLSNNDVPRPASVVADDWLAKQKVYCEGRTVCFSGQTVHITSGRGRTIVSDSTPIVGTSAVAFDPTMAQVQSGVSVQVAAQLVPGAEAAVLDVHTYASEWNEPDRPAEIRGAVATQPSGGAVTTATVDRTNMVAQEMKTTLRVPLGKRYVVGGMTLDPAAAPEGGGRQLCLVVEITAVK